MPRFSLALSALALATQAAVAAPYCDALSDPEAIDKTYKRLAPIYSDEATGWIIASDQLRQDYALKPSAVALVSQIVDEVRARGVELAILVAPPRPIVAGPEVRDAVLPEEAEFDPEAAAASFHGLMAQIAEAGAIAPNLLRVNMDRPRLAEAYYFARDTHWTQQGAAASATALAHAFAEVGLPAIATADIPTDVIPSREETYEERGSLSKVVAEVCDMVLAPEIVPAVQLGQSGAALGLLEDAPASTGPRIALLGTSFSDRYGRDAYRTADAIAHATGLEVDNFSVSGGGALSAIESYVLSGALDQGAHDILVWEMPYTTAFRSVSGLRQLLGALRSGRPRTFLAKSVLTASGQTEVSIPDNAARSFLIEVDPVNTGAQRVLGKVIYDNGSSTKITFYRSARMPAAERDGPIRMSIEASSSRRPVAIDVSFDPKHATGSVLSVHALN